jgi:MFS family permease
LALLDVATFTTVSEYFNSKKTIAFSFTFASVGVGTVVLSQVIIAITEASSWRTALRWLGAAHFVLMSIGTYLMKPFYRNVQGRATQIEMKKVFDISSLKDYRFALFCVAHLFDSFGLFYSFTFIEIFAVWLGYSSSEASILLVCIGLADSTSRIVLSVFAEGTRRKRRYGYLLAMFALGILYVVLSICDPDYTTLIVWSILFGVFYASVRTLDTVVLSDLVPLGHSSRAFGLANAIRATGTFASAPISSWLFDLTGSYTASGLFIGLCFIVAFICGVLAFFLKVTSKEALVEHVNLDANSSNTIDASTSA